MGRTTAVTATTTDCIGFSGWVWLNGSYARGCLCIAGHVVTGYSIFTVLTFLTVLIPNVVSIQIARVNMMVRASGHRWCRNDRNGCLLTCQSLSSDCGKLFILAVIGIR
ncbi:hypothetical protein PAXRUDRAFT_259046 [Paxillus rubicundulus Ve08.2h10]|uniref:Uncharacterized protein n=1 Tax=Paxillus rubicundulus Ve08.2h10 TaxID=930991 RepID=A0A0D0CWJ7_9AGAM|nr:hypothetical protein PAXRUDRAFT_259046 [Paxillus rubicundulus Ve08.2h10]